MTARRSSLLAFGLSLLLTSATAGAVDPDPSHLAVPGDFNGDGRLDVLWQPLMTSGNGGLVLQDGTGNMSVVAQGWEPGYLGLDWSTGASTLTAADLNGDGQDDVLIQPVKAGGTAAVIITDPSVQLLQLAQLLPTDYLGLDWSSASLHVVAGDFDGDHHKELLLQAAQRGATGALVHADPSGRLAAVMQQFTDGFLGRRWNAQDETLYVGDFNGDGRQDLLVQSQGALPGESAYALLLADGDGRFTQLAETWNLSDFGADWDPATHRIVIEDANGDGIMDITLRSTTGGGNFLFEGNAEGRITEAAAHWTGDQSAAQALASQAHAGSISISTATGSTDAAAPQTTTALAAPQSLQTQSVQNGAQLQSVTGVGALQGRGGVSGGTATYSIPIAVPPGIAGMQPSVSLNYSSRGGNGEMGMGWSLSAGSQIHRCPATQAMDGYTSGVTYAYVNNDPAQASRDRLCLDGQHLILVSGTYGSDGAQYRTELEGFSLITEFGPINSNTSHFSVTGKNGHTYGYGATSGLSAVFTPAGAPAPLAWGLALELDPYNNSIIYGYTNYGPGEYLLTSINYTGTGNQPGTREVDFGYQTRGDTRTQYLAGGLTQQTQLLSTITTHQKGNLVRTYNLAYTSSAATTRSLLSGVQECAGSGAAQQCLPQTSFGWHAPATGFNAVAKIDEDISFAPGTESPVFVRAAGDFDGDGRKDLFVDAPNIQTLVYFLKSDGSLGRHTDVTNLFGTSGGLVDDSAGDLNNDGAADLLGFITGSGGATWFAYSTYDAVNNVFRQRTNLQIPASYVVQGYPYSSFVTVADVDGDGLVDIVAMAPDPTTGHSGWHALVAYLNHTTKCAGLGCLNSANISTTPTVLFSMPDYTDSNNTVHVFAAKPAGDVDGNGLPDFDITYLDASGTHYTFLFLKENPSGTLLAPFVAQDKATLGIAALALDTNRSPRTMDINGDGLPDILYDCDVNNHDWCYQLNMGGTFAHYVDTHVAGNFQMASQEFTADLNNDGTQELLFPSLMVADYCSHYTNYHLPGGDIGPADICADSSDSSVPGVQLTPLQDSSIYKFAALKFVPNADATAEDNSGYRYKPTGTGFSVIGQAHLAVPMDLQGDGLTAIVSPFTIGGYGNSFVRKTSDTFFRGPGIVSNSEGSTTSLNAAPDLMLSSNDGFQHTENWDYYPLSSSKSVNGMPLYASPAASGGYAGDDYFYFSSSMYVVGSYVADNGAGSANTHDFHYGQAIYNSQGRGFQGFRTVVDDDMASGARSVQVYHQRFPLSGTLQESWTTTQADNVDLTDPAPAMGPSAVDHVVNTWACMQGSQPQMTVQEATPTSCVQGKLTARTYAPALRESVETHFDVTTHHQISQTDTQYCLASGLSCTGTGSTRGYDAYGNPLGSYSVTTDAYGTYSSSVANTYDTPDTTGWWIDKLKEKVTDVQATYVGSVATAPVVRTTDYDYYAQRTLNHVFAHADGSAGATTANELDTHYTYSILGGNVASVTVSGGSGVTAVAARTTTTTYSAAPDAGYFPATVTDPAGLVTTYQYDPGFGEVASQTTPDGVVTNITYDVFGRKASVQVSSSQGTLPAQTIQYVAHVSGDGMCDGATAYSPYYALVSQEGHPTQYTCFDSLNRSIRSATESFATESDLVYQGTDYDARGRVLRTSEPHFTSQAVVWNYNYYDDSNILGRLDHRTDAKGVMTAYTYNPDTTLVGAFQNTGTRVVTTTPGAAADSSIAANNAYSREDDEVQNSLGKLLRVTNAVGAAEQAATNYTYDSDGNPTTIVAADGSQIVASYDVLGHKTDVTDPDQGHTGYVYDVLGELKSQTDAKLQTQSMTYDPDGRMLTKTAPEGITTWCYDGQVYAATGCSGANVTRAMGKVSSVAQGDGTQYQENYGYDSYGRVSRDEEVIDTVPYDTDTGYDADGRVDTVTYPAGIANATPVANAGALRYVAPGDTVTLQGSATDSDGPQAPAYQWTQTAGPAVTLSDSATATPSFTAGATPGTSYTFQLSADDGLSAGTDSVTITIPHLPPAPAAPTDTGDTNHDGTYTVSWNTVSVTGATITYHLQEAGGTSAGPTQSYHDIYVGSAISAPVSHPGNSFYYFWYRVFAEAKVNGNSVGPGPNSPADSIHVVVTPGQPTSIGPNNGVTNTGTYNVSWTPNNGALPAADVYYQLYESTSSTLAGAYMVYSGGATSTSITQNSMGDYYYEVRACNTNGGVTECSPFKLKAHEIVDGTTGKCTQVNCQPQSPVNHGGSQAPAPSTTTGPTGALTVPAQTLPALDIGASSDRAETRELAIAASAGSRDPSPPGRRGGDEGSSDASDGDAPMDGIRPRFAAPVYQAWAGAKVQTVSGTTPVVSLKVQYQYTANGYLWKLVDAVNANRVYWHLNEFAGGAGNTDAAGNFYEHGMDARGNPTDVYLGGGTVTTHYGYGPDSGYLSSISSTDGGSATYQSMSYQWFATGNLQKRSALVGANNLSETFDYDLHNRIKDSTVTNASGPQTPVTYTYDGVGNITTRSDAGSYTYGGTAGPHAVTTITGAQPGTYGYDPNGNMTNRNGTLVTWNSDNLPTNLTKDANNSTAFSYAPDKHRYKQVAMNAGVQETTLYLGGMEVFSSGGTTHYKHTLMAYGRPVYLDDLSNTATTVAETRSVLLTDHLGSVDTVVDVSTSALQHQSFGTFGKRRDPNTWQPISGGGVTATKRGYTDHEHLDQLGLIHMNGRVYDPTVGRFLSVDPVFQAPTNTQSVNPYSYVMNNPLSLVDPSGYCASTDSSTGGDSTGCDGGGSKGTFNDTATGSHIDQGRQGAAQQKVDASVRKLGGIANTLGILHTLGQKLGGDVAKYTTNLAAGLQHFFGGNGVDGWQGTNDGQNKPASGGDINSPQAISRGKNAVLNNDQIGNIVFNETKSENGGLIDLAREVAIDTVINGDEELGASRPESAKDTVDTKKLNKDELKTLASVRSLVVTVRAQRGVGVDLADGATHFNLRDPEYLKQFNKNLDSTKWGLQPETKLGPFSNSYPTEVLGPTNNWFETYKNPE